MRQGALLLLWLSWMPLGQACGGGGTVADAGGDEADGVETDGIDGADVADDGGGGGTATILRDEYGVPHIFADSRRGAAFAWGYVQAQDIRERLLANLYAGEGRAAATFGHDCGEEGDCAAVDLRTATWGIVAAVEAGYDDLQEDTREVLEAYAAGVNRFFEELDPPSPYFVRPVTARSVVGTMMLVRLQHAIGRSQVSQNLAGGSNQFAATGTRTPAGTTVVSLDPHTPWGNSQRAIHVHYDDYDIVGLSDSFPAIHCGGNNFLHWGCTTLIAAVGVVVGAELSADGNAYFDHAAGAGGAFVPFTRRTVSIPVAGEPVDEVHEIDDTRFGPVVTVRDGHAYAMHLFSAGDITIADYFVGMWQARTLDDFVALFGRSTSPETATNRIVGTADHRVGYVYGAYLPVLDDTLDWSLPVSSADPRIEWAPERWYNIDGADPELPHILDPVGDYAQNCNGHPAWSTDPPGQIPTTIPRYVHAGGPTVRDERLRELLAAGGVDAARAMAIATDLEVPFARRGIEALRRGLAAEGITDPAARWGADVGALLELLLDWRDVNDYRATADSAAMTAMFHVDRIAEPDYPAEGATLPLAVIEGLAAAATTAAADMRARYGAAFADPLRVPWGYVHRATVGGREVPMPGGTERLPALFMAHGDLGTDGRMNTNSGSHYMQVASYSPAGFEVFLGTANGQTDETLFPDSPHVGQTIDAFAAGTYRRMWLDRTEIEAHLCPHGADPTHEHAARLELTWP
jgi:acyl-homoserine lactone acylase PvdQ